MAQGGPEQAAESALGVMCTTAHAHDTDLNVFDAVEAAKLQVVLLSRLWVFQDCTHVPQCQIFNRTEHREACYARDDQRFLQHCMPSLFERHISLSMPYAARQNAGADMNSTGRTLICTRNLLEHEFGALISTVPVWMPFLQAVKRCVSSRIAALLG